ncbi:MAG: hypothetical protein ABR538_03285 [Candidatus Binatia bacterium]
MKRTSALPLAFVLTLSVSACSKEEAPAPGAPAANTAPAAASAPAAGDKALEKIPILPGYKYYVGGPVMSKDAYGRFRLERFDGEVQQPPSRGMVFGAKREGEKLEYRVWGNGRLLGFHRGTMRGGVFWQDYVEGYRQGAVTAREHLVHDDVAKRSKVTTEDIDPETGEVIRTKESSVSYLPLAIPNELSGLDDDDDEEEDEEEDGAAAPRDAAPAPAPKEAAE